MNSSRVALIVAAGLAFVLVLVVFTAAYVSKSSQLTVMEGRAADNEKEARRLETEVAALEEKLAARDSAIQGLERKNSQSEVEAERAAANARRLRDNVETVGKCLKGTFGLILAARREDYGQMRSLLGAMEEPCKQSGTILDNLEKSGPASGKVSMY